MKKSLLLTMGLVFGLVAGCATPSTEPEQPPSSANGYVQMGPGQDNWLKIGQGNLDVLLEEGGFVLFPTATTYTPGVAGSKGKEFRLGTLKAYKLKIQEDDSIWSKELPIEEIVLKSGESSIPLVRIEERLLLANGQKNDVTAENETLLSDYEANIGLIAKDGASVRKLLDTSGREAFLEKARKKFGSGEGKMFPYWAVSPKTIHDGKQIVFVSNVDEELTGQFALHLIDTDGSNHKVIVSGGPFNGLHRILGVAGNVVIVQTGRNSVVQADLGTGGVKEFPIGGTAEILSPDASRLIFRKDQKGLLPDLWVLNLKTGEQAKASGMPQGYFYNSGGEWSPDGAKFAFYGLGENNRNAAKSHRDNNILLPIWITTPCSWGIYRIKRFPKVLRRNSSQIFLVL